MKLIILKTLPPQKNNGAEIGNLERFRLLKALGWQVEIHTALNTENKESAIKIMKHFGAIDKNDHMLLDHIPCFLHLDPKFHYNNTQARAPLRDFFHGLLSQYKPDVVWTQYTEYPASSAALLWNASRTWVDICDNEFPRLPEMSLDPQSMDIAQIYQLLRYAIVASPFMAKQIQEAFPFSNAIHLPYPMPELRFPTANIDRKFWLFVNPVPMKGLNFVIDLAKRLPFENFAFVRNWAQLGDLENLPGNVTLIPQQATLKPLFVHSKGLLMPSQWDEAFGRVPLEAMAASVPVISSNKGALPETVGAGGVVLPLEIECWLDTMTNSDPSFWESLVLRGHERVKAYLRQCEGIYRSFLQTKQQTEST